MNDSELEVRLQKIEQRLAAAEVERASGEAVRHQKAAAGIRATAKLLALRSLVQELAVSAGVSPGRAEATFERRSLYYLDCLHRMAESRNATLAALADDRRLEEVPTDDAFPTLFDEAEE